MSDSRATQRLRVAIRGAVQGVGFRPFVYRLATELALAGWVKNSSQGVQVEVEGTIEKLEHFLLRIEREKPSRSFIQSLEWSLLDSVGYSSFVIHESDTSGVKRVLVLPDIATCSDCLKDIFDSTNRRFRYPFTNCTNCGPRFSIIQTLPYDRPKTTMKKFAMCAECQREYENPLDRRFHAQPNACAHCGPHLELWDFTGKCLAKETAALTQAAEAIRRGALVAVKSMGGFQLLADARQDKSIARLRQGKHREEKPFALMYPSLDKIEKDCEVSPMEARLLTSPEAPIVLVLRRTNNANVSENVAPKNPYWGIMLPYTPLHHLLLVELGFPIVATSGNLSDEPICTDEREALQRLGHFTDFFLVHDRPIARHVDDSIVRVMAGRELMLRRARGYVPLPIQIKQPCASPILAVGAHLKNAIALGITNGVFISQHIGDLETVQAHQAFRSVINDFEQMYEAQPSQIGCDLHPEYLSTKYARARSIPTRQVQHHLAHVASCMAENEIEAPVLGVAWDGTGLGLDGTIWGGEFFLIENASAERVAHLRPFGLPGGEQAIKEPRRSALGLFCTLFGESLWEEREARVLENFLPHELKVLREMLAKQINTPLTSSVGRLFDAVASIVGLRQETKFEGQAAMELEFALMNVKTDEAYSFNMIETLANVPSSSTRQKILVADWEAIVREVISDVRLGLSIGTISAKFHNALVEMIVTVAQRVKEEKVVLSGGCFQNKYLTERAVERLRAAGFRPYWHQRVPPNDGGIALGQIVIASQSKKSKD